jgi:NhaP-type Na+/H+ or K+/H+ antiporter
MSLAYLLADAKADQRVVIAMLITGLVFVGVIALGETLHWLRNRRSSN